MVKITREQYAAMYGPTTGEKLQSFIVSVFDTPKSTLDELKAALASK